MSNPASTSPLPPSPDDDDLELLATMPGFLPPPTPRGPDPLDPEATTIRPPSDGPDFSSEDELDELDDERPSPSEPPKSSPASTADPSLFVDVARTAVGIASIGVGWLRAKRHGPAIAQAWIADEEDQANIGDPLARIAARRIPAAAGEAAPDVVDGIDALMGTVNYGLRHARAEAETIAHFAGGAADEEPAQ